MRTSTRTALTAIAASLILCTRAYAQAAAQPPVTFVEYVGTWTLDETASTGHIAGVPAPKTLTIATSAETFRVGTNPASLLNYRTDGTELKMGSDRTTRFTLAAGKLVLTSTQSRMASGNWLINTTTDVYTVSGDTLTIDRQVSVIVKPADGGTAGHVVTPGSGTLDSLRQTSIYRRESR